MKRYALTVLLGLTLVASRSSLAQISGSLDPILPSATKVASLRVKSDDSRIVSLSGSLAMLGEVNTMGVVSRSRLSADLIGLLAISADTLLSHSPAPDAVSLGFDGKRPPARFSLRLDGKNLVLQPVSQVIDPKTGDRHITLVSPTAPDSFTRFSVSPGGFVVGTIETPGGSYRVLPESRNAQSAYRLSSEDGRPARYTLLVDAADPPAVRALEHRHRQVLHIADIEPNLVMSDPEGRVFALRGGRLGRLNIEAVTSESLESLMHPLADLFSGGQHDELRLEQVYSHHLGGEIKFQQVINGIPVWQKNDIRLTADGTVTEINAKLIDPSRITQTPLMAEADALKIAIAAVERRVERSLSEVQLIKPTTLRYELVTGQRRLVPIYTFFVDTRGHGDWIARVDAQTGSVEVADPMQYADALGYFVCRPANTSVAPQTCSDTGADIIWRNPIGGTSSCSYSNPMSGGGNICTGPPYGPSQGALLNADRALKNLQTTAPGICCSQLGGSDRTLDVVVKTGAVTGPNATYNPAREVIASPVGNNELDSVETVWHELGHHIFWMDNPQIGGMYDHKDPQKSFATSFIESYADLMDASFTALSPAALNAGDPWVHGDGLRYSGTPRVLNDYSLDFSYLAR